MIGRGQMVLANDGVKWQTSRVFQFLHYTLYTSFCTLMNTMHCMSIALSSALEMTGTILHHRAAFQNMRKLEHMARHGRTIPKDENIVYLTVGVLMRNTLELKKKTLSTFFHISELTGIHIG